MFRVSLCNGRFRGRFGSSVSGTAVPLTPRTPSDTRRKRQPRTVVEVSSSADRHEAPKRKKAQRIDPAKSASEENKLDSVDLTPHDYLMSCTKDQLREMLRHEHLPVSGTKEQLVSRLLQDASRKDVEPALPPGLPSERDARAMHEPEDTYAYAAGRAMESIEFEDLRKELTRHPDEYGFEVEFQEQILFDGSDASDEQLFQLEHHQLPAWARKRKEVQKTWQHPHTKTSARGHDGSETVSEEEEADDLYQTPPSLTPPEPPQWVGSLTSDDDDDDDIQYKARTRLASG